MGSLLPVKEKFSKVVYLQQTLETTRPGTPLIFIASVSLPV